MFRRTACLSNRKSLCSNESLISAIKNNDELQVKSLFENGVNVNYRKHGELCVEYMPLHLAAERGNTTIVQLLIENGAEVDGLSELSKGIHETIPTHKDTPLIIAAENCHVEIVEILLKAGANINHKRNFGETALHVASEKGYDTIVETLIKHGANPNETDSKKNAPLNIAAKYDHFKVAELLVNAGANLNVQDDLGYTPLNTAAMHGRNIETAQLLVEKGADVNITTSYHNRTPLYWSTSRGRDQLSALLIQKGADVNIADKTEDSPFIYAVRFASIEIVDLMIKHGANVNQRDYQNRTALDISYNKTIKELLKKAGATRTNLDRSDSGGIVEQS